MWTSSRDAANFLIETLVETETTWVYFPLFRNHDSWNWERNQRRRITHPPAGCGILHNTLTRFCYPKLVAYLLKRTCLVWQWRRHHVNIAMLLSHIFLYFFYFSVLFLIILQHEIHGRCGPLYVVPTSKSKPGCATAEALPVVQPTVSKHWRCKCRCNLQ